MNETTFDVGSMPRCKWCRIQPATMVSGMQEFPMCAKCARCPECQSFAGMYYDPAAGVHGPDACKPVARCLECLHVWRPPWFREDEEQPEKPPPPLLLDRTMRDA